MKLTTIIASAAVAAVLGGAGVSVAGAASGPGSSLAPTAGAVASTTPSSTGPAATVGPKAGAAHKGLRALRRRVRRGAGRVVAETIGITRPVLRQELKAGKTIAAIATEHGVPPQAVISALQSAATTKIDAAVAADKITAEQAAKLKQRLQTAIPKIVNDWHPKHATHG